MSALDKLLSLREKMQQNVQQCILPFWCDFMEDTKNGGFWGMVDNDLQPVADYPKAIVLNCRMLWTYSMAYSVFRNERYAELAKRAFSYIRDHFWDKEFGGAYWMLNYQGIPLEIEKRTYGQAFIIYSMAEYYHVFGDQEALDMAMNTFELVNRYVRYENGGYADSVQRDWSKDFWVWKWVMNPNGAAKLLNSHLHLFEATITLLEATGSEAVKATLKEFLLFLLDVAFDKSIHHLKAGMDENGDRIDNEVSFGHDSECSYLLVWAAQLIGEPALLARAEQTALDIMEHVYAEGLDPVLGGMYNESDLSTGHVDKSKVWWVQAEGITAFINCYQISGNQKFVDAAAGIWKYVEENLVDWEKGEWFAVGYDPGIDDLSRISADNTVRMCCGKASKPKCPYHNSRSCFEMMKRVALIQNSNG